MGSIKKYVYITIGSLSLVLGITGLFLPVLPTTPFLLLASFFYLRSSERMYNWLMNHKIFGAYIYSYLTYKAIPIKTKVSAMIFLWSTLIISIMLVASLHIRIFLLAVGIAVTAHLLMLKTLSNEDLKKLDVLHLRKTKAEALSEKN